MHFYSNCHSPSVRRAKIVEVIFSEKTGLFFAIADLRPRNIKRRVSKRKKRQNFDIEAVFADAKGNTATIF